MQYPVHVYGPRFEASGYAAILDVDEAGLYLAALNLKLNYSQMTAYMGGFNHDQLQLHWSESDLHPEDSTYMLTFDQKKDQAHFIKRQQTHAAPIKGLKGWKKDHRRQKTVWHIVLVSAVILVFTILFTVFQYQRVVGWIAASIPVKTEVKIGKKALEMAYDKDLLIQKGPAYDTLVKFGTPLTKGSPYAYQWYIAKDPSPNAISLPGGRIIVTTGLMDVLNNPNQLNGVLAHEIAHVEQRHSLKNMIGSSGIALALAALGGDINSLLLVFTHQSGQAYHSRQLETEADIKGYRLLVNRQYNPVGLHDALGVLSRLDEPNANLSHDTKNKPAKPKISKDEKSTEELDDDFTTGWLDNRPALNARMQALKVLATKEPCVRCKPVSWDRAAIEHDLKQLKEDN